jgi:peptide/nickel transport system substrate-binding protein
MASTRVALLAGTAVLALAAACGGPAATSRGTLDEGAPVAGGRLTLSIANDPSAVDPLALVTPTDRQVAAAVYEPLVELNQDGQLVPALALSWDSPDAKTWTVTLRPAVEFSDGTAFNATAVIANFDRARASKTCSACLASLGVITATTRIDDLTVQFDLKAPLASFPAYLNDTYSSMVSPAGLARYGNDIGKHPVGTGPFVMVRRDAQGFGFDRNPTYWDAGKPYLDGLDMRIIPDQQGAFAALQAGDVDVLANTNDTLNSQAATDPRMRVIQVAGLGTNSISLNSSKAPFDDLRARQAVAMATDRDTLLRLTHPGATYERVDGPWPSGMPVTGAAESSRFPPYDVERAKQLVTEVGGISFTLETYNVGSFPQQAQALQSMWGQAGIKAEIQLADAATVVADATAQRPQALLSTWSGRPDPDLNAYRYLHSNVGSPAVPSDPELDHLLDQGRTTVDPAARKEIYQKLVDRIGQVVPIVYFDGLKKSVIVNSDTVGGGTPPPDGNVRPAGLWNRSASGAR